MQTVQELIEMVVKALVDQPDQVVVKKVEGERSIIFEVRVATDDVGRVVGKGGRIANSLRTIVRAAGARDRKSIWIDINKLPDEPEEAVDGEPDD